MRKAERARKICEALKKLYPAAECTLNYSTPLELLIATQLSAQCTDARVNIVTAVLFERCKTAEDYVLIDTAELEEIIRSAGFYKNKAKNIKACCGRILEAYGGEIPDSMEDLLTLAGTGRKTANLVLGQLYKKPAIVADTHCIRLSNRMGLVSAQDPVKTENELKKLIPPDEQLDFCHRTVAHGRAVCTARNPKCAECGLYDICKRVIKK